MKRRTPTRRKPATPPPAPAGVPASEDIEAAALGCVWLAADDGSMGQVDALLGQLSGRMFDNPRNRLAFETAQAIRAGGNHLDPVVWRSWCKGRPEWNGMDPDAVWSFRDQTPSPWNFPTYLDSLKTEAVRRLGRAKNLELAARLDAQDFNLEELKKRLGEILDASQEAGRQKGPPLTVVKLSEHIHYQPNEDVQLVGDGDVTKGYQGITVIGGPPGSGKSLVAWSLAIAGAIGRGEWMGRKIHRRFRTLIIQCENGAIRMKKEFALMQENYPDVPLDDFIRVSLPPEGGLPFHRPEFRRELGRIVDGFRPDVMVVDPWTQVAPGEGGSDIIEKLAEVRSMLPPGDSCPALVIVAHTSKPRAENGIRRGRSAMNEIVGSQALISSARCVCVLRPFTDEPEDHRIVWTVAKMSDGAIPPESVWFRRVGRLFDPCSDSVDDFYKTDSKDRKGRVWLTVEMLRKVLMEPAPAALTKSRLCETLADQFNEGGGVSSVHKWLKESPFKEHLAVHGSLLSWQD